MEFSFTNEIPASQTDRIVDYLLGPRLWIPNTDYPDYLDWAHRAHGELQRGTKRAMTATAGRELVGAVIYQSHKTQPDTLEIKNITVRPEARGRYIASFLLRNSEIEGARDFRSSVAVVDTKATNIAMRRFLLTHGYGISGQTDLYGIQGGVDMVFKKRLIGLSSLPQLTPRARR